MKNKRYLAMVGLMAVGGFGCADSDVQSTSSVKQFEITSCPATFPHGPQDAVFTSPPASSFSRDKELVITDLSAVQSSCQASWTAPAGVTCTSATLGKWTFGWLMTAMAGDTSVTSPRAQKFVANWLTNWLTAQTVAPDPTPVAARPKIWDKLLKPWLVASTCMVPTDTVPPNPAVDAAQRSAAVTNCASANKLNLTAAPFRLSAIVNRLDLDGRDYNGNGAPGELRFVFGGIDMTSTASPKPQLNFAIILEYHFPALEFSFLRPFQWASKFHALAPQTFGPSFNTQLQDITDRVTAPNAWPSRPNGSAISHVRTNENAFDSRVATNAKLWEFRQFGLATCTDVNLTGACLLQQPVSQTPPNTDNGNAWLTSFLGANLDAATHGIHVVPPAHLGGASQSLSSNQAFVWNTQVDLNDPEERHVLVGPDVTTPAGVVASLRARHGFAFSTCNGCHYLETKNQNQQFHIAPRPETAPAQLSEFVRQELTPSTYDEVTDPNPDSESYYGLLYFDYNEIWRRSCELRRILSGSSLPYATPTGHH